eukprot:CAMPEP_0204198994 /NCGR_PEP_ID=MMETSP0361-20130328/65689_1 /ASSEMBLY_ACC=CAM_ASM_000343 /TAXON_ID=268821 /ORGANISM="Scrippsiella Hangoei, Strain SHTV-5" /LENGTH=136 /DNA_ID=CAMNT_0051161207 /DNA_START=24 /DNA_END=430 /DNA_ORIENTATION=+
MTGVLCILDVVLGATSGSFITTVVQCVAGFAVPFFYRAHARDKAAIESGLVNFSVRDCVCFVEADRPVVYRNIADLMRTVLPELGDSGDDEVALQHFDELVRREIPRAMTNSMGRFALRYRYTLCLGMCAIGLRTP